jgi:L-fuculose-phosphate aldolase
MPDPRAGLKECELCDSAEFRPGTAAPAQAKDSTPADPQIEAVVQQITEQILKALAAK